MAEGKLLFGAIQDESGLRLVSSRDPTSNPSYMTYILFEEKEGGYNSAKMMKFNSTVVRQLSS